MTSIFKFFQELKKRYFHLKSENQKNYYSHDEHFINERVTFIKENKNK